MSAANSGTESPDGGDAPRSGEDQQVGSQEGGGGEAKSAKLSMDPCTVQLLSLILELLSFCVEHHTYHIKNYILHKDLLRRILVLMNSRHTFLVLCKFYPDCFEHFDVNKLLNYNLSFPGALRFMRKIIALKDEFYNRYIIKGNLFAPVVDAFVSNNGRYNLLDSAILEMFEFIKLVSLASEIVIEGYDCISSISK